jgi:hypothetical protein
MSVPYSSYVPPTLGQIKDTKINADTLANGDVLQYNSSVNAWENAVGGGGGGGASITGSDEAAVFKSGIQQGEGDAAGITRNPTFAGYTMNLDTGNKRVGINKQNPTTTLDVNGNVDVAGIANFTDNLQTITISEQKIGVSSAAPNELKLYSANLPAVPSGLTTIDSVIKKTGSSAWRSYDPDAFDAPNTTDQDSIYKIKLQDGTTRQTVATTAFDIQEPFRPLSFPTGQIVEYSNKLPLQKPIIISRNLGPQTIAPAGVRVITSFGLRRNAPFFDDGMTYDPCNMRAKLTGVGWNSAGAPVVYRVADLKLGFTISWNIHGTWFGSGGGQLHRGDVYVVQYRNGVVLYNHLVQQLEQEDEIWWIGKKTFLGWDATAGEDFDPLTDYYEVELTNQAGIDLTYNSAQVEIECWLAQ